MTQTVMGFKLERSEEEITPYGGLGLYGELYKAVGVEKGVRREMPVPGSGAGYEANSYVLSAVMMLIAGGRRLEDIRKVKMDRALRRITGIKEVPSADAIGDWLRRNSGKKIKCLKKLHEMLSKKVIVHAEEKEFTLDIDATEIVAEKYESKMDYKGNKGYMPILGFLAELDWCIGYEFREGNESPGSRNKEFALGIIKRMKKLGKKIGGFRSDSAAYQAELMNELNREGIRYGIPVDQDAAVKGEIARIPANQWKAFMDKDGIKTDRETAEFIHSMNKSDHSFRVVVQRWKNPQRDLFEEAAEYCYHGIASNELEEEQKSEAVIVWHNARARSENYNKELKTGFRMESMPCGEFEANAVWFGIGMLAYDLFVMSKLYLLPKSWWKKTIGTVRWQLIELAGKVVRSSRQILLKICGVSEEIFEIYMATRRKCWELKTTL